MKVTKKNLKRFEQKIDIAVTHAQERGVKFKQGCYGIVIKDGRFLRTGENFAICPVGAFVLYTPLPEKYMQMYDWASTTEVILAFTQEKLNMTREQLDAFIMGYDKFDSFYSKEDKERIVGEFSMTGQRPFFNLGWSFAEKIFS